MVEECRVTAGLLDALLELAAAREPESVSTLLAVTPAGDLESATADGGGDAAGGDGAGAGGPESGDSGAGGTGSTGAARTGTGRDGGDTTVAPSLADLDPGVPVFTEFYVPSAGQSVDAVFGMDVSVPHGQAQGRFVSHPLGELSVSTGDDLHEVVLVAVPPWTRDDVAAFDRSGRRLPLDVVSAAPPERPFEG